MWLAAIAVCLALSHVHGLAVDVNVKNYRTIGALSVCTTILLAWAFGRIVTACCYPTQQRIVLRILAGWFLIVSLGMGQANLMHYWTSPYPQGYAYLVARLQEKLSPTTRQIHLIRQTVDDGIVAERAIHAFGRPLTEPEWVMPGIVVAALRDVPGEWSLDQIELTESLDPAEAPTGNNVVVIDMRELKNLRN